MRRLDTKIQPFSHLEPVHDADKRNITVIKMKKQGIVGPYNDTRVMVSSTITGLSLLEPPELRQKFTFLQVTRWVEETMHSHA